MSKKNKRAILLVVTVILTVIFLTPYLHMALTSFKPRTEVFQIPPAFFPSQLGFGSYVRMYEYLPFFHYFRNSLIAAIASTFLSVLIGSMAAYAFSRHTFPLSNVFLILTLCTKMLPLIAVAIPVHMLMTRLGLLDTHFALSLVYAVINLPFVIWIMISFFDGIPRQIDEAARIDGCGRLRTFTHIVLPLATPGLAVTAIFCFMMGWNEFLFALLLTSDAAKTVPVGISEFMTVWAIEWGPMCAAGVTFTLPILIFSLFIQKHIVRGITLGAIKG